MINPLLFRKPVAIEAGAHRALRIKPAAREWSVAGELNAMFIATVEFGDACADYPIVFVNAGNDAQGQRQVAPIAVFGLREKENLYVEGARWRVNYIPALLQAYPFGVARLDDNRMAVVIDQAWSGWSTTEGVALFDDQGQPADYLKGMRDQLERVDGDRPGGNLDLLALASKVVRATSVELDRREGGWTLLDHAHERRQRRLDGLAGRWRRDLHACAFSLGVVGRGEA